MNEQKLKFNLSVRKYHVLGEIEAIFTLLEILWGRADAVGRHRIQKIQKELNKYDKLCREKLRREIE